MTEDADHNAGTEHVEFPGSVNGEMAHEILAVLAHRLWAHWSMHIAAEEDISEERLERWREYWVYYEELPEDVKQTDRDLVARYWNDRPEYGGGAGGE